MKAVESFPKALSRELEEELGSVPHYEKLYPLDTYLSEDNEFIYYSFLMIVNEFDSIEVKANETFDYVWMPSHLIERLNLHPGFRLTFEDKRDCIQRIINKNQNRS